MARAKNRIRAKTHFPDASFPFAISRHHLTQKLIGPHAHEFTELVVVLSGRGYHAVGRQRHRIGAGDVFVIGGNLEHAYHDMHELELVNILFQPELIGSHDTLLRRSDGYRALFVLEPRYRRRHGFRSRLRIGAEPLAEATKLIARMEREQASAAAGYEAMVASLLEQLLVLLSREYARVRRGVPKSLSRIGQSVQYLETHLAERVELADLAARAHMSVNTFLRVFKDAVGEPPITHQIRLRVLKGAELITEGGRTITEAAFDLGFSDANYFSRQFAKIMGVSPREYARDGGIA